jgi:hypothetical protein
MANGNSRVQTAPLMRIRVRCDADHTSPWLGRLYVLWADAGGAGGANETAPAQTARRYQVGVTDAEGYLSPLTTNLEPDPQRTIVLAENVEYDFYLIRFPDPAEVQRIIASINGGSQDPWGAPQRLRVTRESVGQRRQRIELLLRVPEQPQSFIPKGSTFYQEWVLFRGMPNEYCPAVVNQVKRLQYQLGTMRYPVGWQGQPYWPRPRQNGNRKGEEGAFDETLWNGVLAFQRDVKAGGAEQMASSVIAAFLSGSNFDPTAAASNSRQQITQSPSFVTAQPAAVSGTIPHETVVDQVTGDQIKTWLQNSYRKPGPVLVSKGTVDTWMDSRMLNPYTNWDLKLESLGFQQRIQVSNILRDVRIGVQTGGGMVATSIHKSGFALDLTMAWGEGSSRYPLHYSKNAPAGGQRAAARVSWTVYAVVPESELPATVEWLQNDTGRIPGEANVEYIRRIQRWVYDPSSADGGREEEFTVADSVFLNLSKLAGSFDFTGISAHQSGWQQRDPISITLTDVASLRDALARLKDQVAHLNERWVQEDVARPETFTIGGNTYRFDAVRSMADTLKHWLILAGRHGANPDVSLPPTGRERDRFIRDLRRNRPLRGKRFLITPSAAPAPAAGATPTPSGSAGSGPAAAPASQPSGPTEITLAADTEFPTTAFTIRPLTDPVTLKPGDTIDFPAILGSPTHLEWWHFQWMPGYNGKIWKDLLRSVGWTEEGLLGRDGNKHIYGFWGIGYTTADLARQAR